MLKVAIVGATGFTGEELVKILLDHPEVKITSLSAKIDKPDAFSDIFGWAKGKINLICDNLDISKVAKKADLIFLALPHRVSMQVAPKFLAKGKKVIDLSADYRLEDTAVYKKWYGPAHKDKKNLKAAVYGLPELYKNQIKKADVVANPGCYPTASILACAPLLAKGVVSPTNIIIDAKSGVTGAGRAAKIALHFSEVNQDLKAYKINEHQHMPEIEQELSKVAGKKTKVTFVPHLVPMDRGILCTVYLQQKKGQSSHTSDVRDSAHRMCVGLSKFYKNAPFVRVLKDGEFPQVKNVVGTNYCDIGIKADEKGIIVVSAIDNLQKGASGQAVQNMNLMCGFDEECGLK